MLFVFSSIGIAILLSLLLTRLFFVRLKKQILQQGILKTLHFKKEAMIAFVEQSASQFLEQKETQILIGKKIDAFLQQELSFAMTFMTTSFIEKIKQKVISQLPLTVKEFNISETPFLSMLQQQLNVVTLNMLLHIEQKMRMPIVFAAALMGLCISLFQLFLQYLLL